MSRGWQGNRILHLDNRHIWEKLLPTAICGITSFRALISIAPNMGAEHDKRPYFGQKN